ncbi:MAG: hypothetical protein M3362_24185, partial [Acidobacteriota bacterium]|nr:hypothetical protein [Acidobacteriota bacterium]
MADGTMILERPGAGERIAAVLKIDRIAENLACVEQHFHTEAQNEIEAALELYTDDIVWVAPAPNGLNRTFSGK